MHRYVYKHIHRYICACEPNRTVHHTCQQLDKYIGVHLCTCMHIYMCAYMHKYIHVNTSIYTCTGMYVHIYICTYTPVNRTEQFTAHVNDWTNTQLRTCMHTCNCVYMHECIYVYVYIYIHAQVCMYTHIYVYTYIPVRRIEQFTAHRCALSSTSTPCCARANCALWMYMRHAATHCDTLRYVATHCTTLQHTASFGLYV